MLKILDILKSASGPGLIALIIYVFIFIFSPSDSAKILGGGTANFIDPFVLALSLLAIISSKKWWHILVTTIFGLLLAYTFRSWDVDNNVIAMRMQSAIGTIMIVTFIKSLVQATIYILRRNRVSN